MMSIFFGNLNSPMTSTFSTKIHLVKLIKEADVAQMAKICIWVVLSLNPAQVISYL
jgi:hypothetical protein